MFGLAGLDVDEDEFGDAGEGGEVEDDVEIFSLDAGWSVDAFDVSELGLGSGGKEGDGEEEELGMASSALLASLPVHLTRQLEADQAEADAANEALRKRRAGGGGGTKPKTQRRLRIIAGTASGVRIRSQVRPSTNHNTRAPASPSDAHARGKGTRSPSASEHVCELR